MATLLRTSWRFGKNSRKSIDLSIYGFNCGFSRYIRVDGDERHVTLHWGMLLGIYLTLEHIIPNSWYPTYHSTTYGELPEERELSISFHDWSFWWNFWMKSHEWNAKDPKWRRNSIDFHKLLFGKHSVTYGEKFTEWFILPFLEGNYSVRVIRKERLDHWTRWRTRKSVSWEVEPGFMDGVGSFKSIPIIHEGKGENSWDQDENGIYSLYFTSQGDNKVRTAYEAALYFWKSCMETRERYGHKDWMPKKFRRGDGQGDSIPNIIRESPFDTLKSKRT